MAEVIHEITPLSERDCFYVVDRHKKEFTYPIHCHSEYELNFIENASGVRRTVGDSVETIGDYDMVLITGNELEHVWEQGDCTSEDIHEITIQFSSELFTEALLNKNQFGSIQTMLENAKCGIKFSMSTIMKVYTRLTDFAIKKPSFHSFISLLELLYELSLADDSVVLSSTSFAKIETQSESRRVQKVQKYVRDHYNEEIRLKDLAKMVGMTSVAFSRFFRQRTGRTLSEYIIEQRLGHAARLLVDSTQTVAEICFDCGFNTLSNFNRLFKRSKGCTPKVFRDNYQKRKIII